MGNRLIYRVGLMILELNQQEASVLTQLLDIANKSAGAQVAKVVVHFLDKIEAAAKAEASASSNEKPAQ